MGKDTLSGLPPGTVLNERYTIIKTIEFGYFEITYQAQDIRSGSMCAIKELAPRDVVMRREDGVSMVATSAENDSFFQHTKKNFLDEANMPLRFNKLNCIVNVYDFFQQNGTCYYTMEYLDGETLGQIVRRRGADFDREALNKILLQVGKGLMQMHRNNVLCRAVEPNNIFITSKGEVKLLDLDIACEIRRDGEDKPRPTVCTSGFSPLEQYSSMAPQGTYTDVYALAATAYYALTGCKLPDALEIHRTGQYRRLTEFGISPDISDAVDKALRTDYRERTQTVEQFLTDMGLMGSSTQTVPFVEMDGMHYNIPMDTTIVVGRSPRQSNIYICESHISRHHLEICYDSLSKAFFIVDDSACGTYVNNVRLERGHMYSIPPQSVIAVGSQKSIIKVGVMNG